ncbi:hypothetical protein MOX02_53490 [Methylobacterium oxalidis]|uniref:DUF2029 domain-containing protein n=1 Tax=Methylobacterium oxalidis TaxID=944322 RepID=A0A512JBN7_9HYPH|nr:hypothetical protein MOX02_53490 [Methylobacterium oxalidis]GLS64105.1 hypothetical protein GCM10007888_24860 [Methylobacterium oxalidis]
MCVGLIASMVSWLAYQPWNPTGLFMTGAPFGRDFVNYWLGPRLAWAGEAWRLADLAAYDAAIRSALGATADSGRIFSYPPHILPPLLPFAALPFIVALTAFTAVNLGALAATLHLSDPNAAKRRGWLVVALVLSPPAATMVMFGQFGGLIALAATVSLLERERRPWLAGLCLAALSVKPQLALILGLILLGAGHWRWLPSAALGTTGLVILSLALFGIEPWDGFISFTLPIQSEFLTDFRPKKIATVCSVFFTARYWGLAPDLAWALQGMASIVALAVSVAVLRRGSLDPAALCVILLGTLVALPYASNYDVVIAAPALTLLLMDRTLAGRMPLLLAAVWLVVPLARIMLAYHIPILSLLMLGAVLREAFRLRSARLSSSAEHLPRSYGQTSAQSEWFGSSLDRKPVHAPLRPWRASATESATVSTRSSAG